MRIFILTDVQYLQSVIFSFEKVVHMVKTIPCQIPSTKIPQEILLIPSSYILHICFICFVLNIYQTFIYLFANIFTTLLGYGFSRRQEIKCGSGKRQGSSRGRRWVGGIARGDVSCFCIWLLSQ